MKILSLLFAPQHLSYIDPNAGGWLFQLLFPVFVAAGSTVLVLRKKASALCRRLFSRDKRNSDERK